MIKESTQNHSKFENNKEWNTSPLLRTVLFLSSLGMLLSSIYLVFHYYELKYPRYLYVKSFCDVSNAFNCDTATLSPLSQIAGIPIAAFGLVLGLIFLLSSIIPKKTLWSTNYTVAAFNFLACLFLFSYSLFVLKSLCPGCVLYYFFSLLVLSSYFYSFKNFFSLNFKLLGLYFLCVSFFALGFSKYTKTQEEKSKNISSNFISLFKEAPRYDEKRIGSSSLKLISSFPDFEKAPLRITVFADFQCAFCKILSENMLKILPLYKGQVNAQFFHYPMDQSCNPHIEHSLHPVACQAAKLSTCMEKDFEKFHDYLFAEQMNLSENWLHSLAKKKNILSCLTSDKTKKTLAKMIEAGEEINLTGTPTLLINGRKLEGLYPTRYLKAIFDYALKEENAPVS